MRGMVEGGLPQAYRWLSVTDLLSRPEDTPLA